MVRDITVQEVTEVCRAANNPAMSHPFLFWLTFALRKHADKDGKLTRGPDHLAGIKKATNKFFPFADATPNDVATAYFDFWFRMQAALLPTPVNLVMGYIGLVAGAEKAIVILQRALEMDATGQMTSEILTELARRDAVPLAYRILSLYCDELSTETQTDVKALLIKWLEYELNSTQRRLDLIQQALAYLR